MRNAICHLITVAAFITSSGTANALTLLDAPTCMEFVTNFDGSLADTNNKKWLLGFLSGMVSHSGRDALRNVLPYTIYHHVYIYCKQYDDAPLNEAAEAFFNRVTREIGG